jgi:hypothetical protein
MILHAQCGDIEYQRISVKDVESARAGVREPATG